MESLSNYQQAILNEIGIKLYKANHVENIAQTRNSEINTPLNTSSTILDKTAHSSIDILFDTLLISDIKIALENYKSLNYQWHGNMLQFKTESIDTTSSNMSFNVKTKKEFWLLINQMC